MIDAMSKVDSVQLRQVIMTQGDEGDFMYVIESGSYEVSGWIESGNFAKGRNFWRVSTPLSVSTCCDDKGARSTQHNMET